MTKRTREDIKEQMARQSQRSAELMRRSEEARRTLRSSACADADPESAENLAPRHNEQVRRQHVFMVNSDAAYLSAARHTLQEAQYNVTTTNLVPQTYAMITAGEVDALIIDLYAGEDEIWSFLDQLASDPWMQQRPVIYTAVDDALLDRAQRTVGVYGGRFYFGKPYEAKDLPDVIHSFIGPA